VPSAFYCCIFAFKVVGPLAKLAFAVELLLTINELRKKVVDNFATDKIC